MLVNGNSDETRQPRAGFWISSGDVSSIVRTFKACRTLKVMGNPDEVFLKVCVLKD